MGKIRGKGAKRASGREVVGGGYAVSPALCLATTACPGCLPESFLTPSWVIALCVCVRACVSTCVQQSVTAAGMGLQPQGLYVPMETGETGIERQLLGLRV